jgi:hypothetical protein
MTSRCPTRDHSHKPLRAEFIDQIRLVFREPNVLLATEEEPGVLWFELHQPTIRRGVGRQRDSFELRITSLPENARDQTLEGDGVVRLGAEIDPVRSCRNAGIEWASASGNNTGMTRNSFFSRTACIRASCISS